MPTRPCKPRDKAKVEGAVLIVERWMTPASQLQYETPADVRCQKPTSRPQPKSALTPLERRPVASLGW
jgi:transposase